MKFRRSNDISIKELMERQLSTISRMFTILSVFFIAVGIMLGYLSLKSSDQITQAQKELIENEKTLVKDFLSFKERIDDKVDKQLGNLENKTLNLQDKTELKVNEKIAEYEQEIAQMTGEILKKPELKLIYNDLPLDGQTIKPKEDYDFPILLPIFLNNIGTKEISFPSINFYSSIDFGLSQQRRKEGTWEDARGTKRENYPYHYQFIYADGSSNDLAIINPQEVDEIPYITLGVWPDKKVSIKCLVEIYFASEPPVKAEFEIKY